MNKMIFGAACMITGFLLTITMLFLSAFPSAYDNLTELGKVIVWGGILVSVFGVGYSLYHLHDK